MVGLGAVGLGGHGDEGEMRWGDGEEDEMMVMIVEEQEREKGEYVEGKGLSDRSYGSR